MAQRFGSQSHPSGGQRFGSQTYAAINASAGNLVASESGVDTFYAEAQPSIHASVALVESISDILSASGVSSLSHTLQAHEGAALDSFIASGSVTNPSSVRFGSQSHPLGGLRFGLNGWAALGPNGPMVAVESGTDTAAAVGFLAGTTYSFAIYDVLASFVDYSSESLGSSITGTLETGYKVMLPVSAAGIVFTWEVNEFGNPSLRLANLTGATVLSAVPWYVWDGSTWITATFSVSDALQGAAFLVESGADVFSASSARYGLMSATEVGDDFTNIPGIVRVMGALSAVESAVDALFATGTPAYAGSMLAVESTNDTAAITGAVVVYGALSVAEAVADAFNGGGVQSHAGSLAATETGSDAFTARGALSSAGALSATESTPADTFAGSGALIVSGVLSGAESSADTFEGAGSSARAGLLAAAESGVDLATLVGAVDIVGLIALIESTADTLAATGYREFSGNLAAAELNAFEGGADRFVGSGINGDLPLTPDFDGNITLESATIRFTVLSKRQAVAA